MKPKSTQDTTNMKFSATKMIGIMVLIGCYIEFPFFKIKYFEIASSLTLIYHYLLFPIVFLSVSGSLFVYIKYLRQLNPKTNSKAKVVLQDICNPILFTIINSAVLFGITLSTIATTNAYCGQSKDVLVVGTVAEYSEHRTKYGGIERRIKFISTYDNELKNLRVYRK